MSGLGIIVLATLALLALGALAAAVVLVRERSTRSATIEVHEVSPDGRLAIRTPFGTGSARLVVHDDLGKVYEITTNLRGDGPSTAYVPPAIGMVRAHLAHRVDYLRAQR